MNKEQERLEEDRRKQAHWRRWGPYVSDRQWGTVREDYSAGGTPWEYFPHDQARSRAYRWGEDGIGGISDNHQRLCFALSLWNGEDPFLKERFFGLTGHQGNHGEDVKEYYFHLDNTPTHSYMKMLYKYPQKAYPYDWLLQESSRRGKLDPEFELLDTGIFNEDRYHDIFIEYAKGAPEDILIRITAVNRGPEKKTLHILPTLWFRNTWSWNNASQRPSLRLEGTANAPAQIEASHPTLGTRWLAFESPDEILFTENETNVRNLYGLENPTPYVKDGINEYVVNGNKQAVNPARTGTKCSLHFILELEAGSSKTLRLRLREDRGISEVFGKSFDQIFETREKEAREFYEPASTRPLPDEMKDIQRQAFAGLLWNKQFYHYVVEDWLKGDPAMPPPPPERKSGRNHEWRHLYNEDVLSMPDKWEFPWFAAWDLGFHLIALARIDPEFAKQQLVLLTREWYMHPNGQVPAYEWALGDLTPPIQAWAAWRIYKIEKKIHGQRDLQFLERVFQKLLLNFTWWVNRKDPDGLNVFEGGFLGLDNIGVFDRNVRLPTGGHLEQSDGTSWMGMYCLNMLTIALELAAKNPVYEDIASKFFEHFLYIADGMNRIGDEGLWNEDDGFYYDTLHADGRHIPLQVRSMVGLIPLFAVETLEPGLLDSLPAFKKRMEWFIQNRPDLSQNVASMEKRGVGERRLLSIVSPKKLSRILQKMLDESEFLSPHGIRSLSRFHEKNPYTFHVHGQPYRVDYEPGESRTGIFGGNSNWRGPVWFPVNYLLIESLQKFHYYLGNEFKVECPSGSGHKATLWDIASDISHRLTKIFLKDETGRRPVFGGCEKFQSDPHWRDYLLFYEYFNGDDGSGLGASHQTGWTGLAAKLIQQSGEYRFARKSPELSPKKTDAGIQAPVLASIKP